MNVGHVEGGTHAGWRIVKPAIHWTHDCTPKDSTVYVMVTLTSYSCPVCGERRPGR